MRQRIHFALCVLAFFGAVFSGNLTGLLPDALEAAQQERPRLFVLVVFDQMRGDYLSRWESHFAEGGFRRLCNEGTWFQNCHYPYAGTLTGAGHASLLSGANPSTHGIVANEWYVPALKTSVNCVSSLKHERVPRLLGVKSEGG